MIMQYTKKLYQVPTDHFKFKIGKTLFDFKRSPAVMAILNCTPDSFYDGGRWLKRRSLIYRIHQIKKEGADIIDIGAESTRPGSRPVSVKEEIKRLMPAYELCRKIAPDIPISIDTWKSQTAKYMLKEGADIINDISGLSFDKKMLSVLEKYKPAVILMHTPGKPSVMQKMTNYKNLILDIQTFLKKAIEKASCCGINRIIIDPGIGFGKTVEQNYEILKNIKKFNILKRPVLIGLSRKSLIGKILNIEPEKRLAPTMALNLQALLSGVSIIRVHDVLVGRWTVILYHYLKRGAK